MKKITKEKKEVELIEVLCDICGNNVSYNSGLSSGHSCEFCGKDLCIKHSIPDYNIFGNDDYPAHFCDDCWKKGIPFREKLEEETRHHDEIVEKLLGDWKNQCNHKPIFHSEKHGISITNEVPDEIKRKEPPDIDETLGGVKSVEPHTIK